MNICPRCIHISFLVLRFPISQLFFAPLQAWVLIHPSRHISLPCSNHTPLTYILHLPAGLRCCFPADFTPTFPRCHQFSVINFQHCILSFSLEAVSGFPHKALVSGQSPEAIRTSLLPACMTKNRPPHLTMLFNNSIVNANHGNIVFYTIKNSHLFQHHGLDVIQKPRTEQARV